MTKKTKNIESFTAREIELLSGIAADWVNEGIVLPPYEPDLESLLKKLGVVPSAEKDETYPKTQERLSRHGVNK